MVQPLSVQQGSVKGLLGRHWIRSQAGVPVGSGSWELGGLSGLYIQDVSHGTNLPDPGQAEQAEAPASPQPAASLLLPYEAAAGA